MLSLKSYMQLMRFHKPVGIWLLWFPTAWALWLSNANNPPVRLILLFFIGTVVMRAAGCVINDIADRQIDKHISRTRWRPLTNGDISLIGALVNLVLLLFIAFIVLAQLPSTCFYYALPALFITISYPFCKRFMQAPQLVLGFAFSSAIPMVFAASKSSISSTAFLLISINLLWVIAYDTMYAMVDKKDDLRSRVKSTAILFGTYDRFIIGVMQLTMQLLWIILAREEKASISFYFFWGLSFLPLVYQQKLLASQKETAYFQAFKNNVWYGLMLWLALLG